MTKGTHQSLAGNTSDTTDFNESKKFGNRSCTEEPYLALSNPFIDAVLRARHFHKI
jgi:hypothetical protein